MNEPERFAHGAAIWRDTFGLFVGPGRRFACDAVAAASGVHVNVLRKYGRGEATPAFANLLAITSAVGPELANAYLAHAGIGHARALTVGTALPERTLTALLREGSELAEDLEDGRLDHVERKRRATAFRELSQMLAEQAAALDPPALDLGRPGR